MCFVYRFLHTTKNLVFEDFLSMLLVFFCSTFHEHSGEEKMDLMWIWFWHFFLMKNFPSRFIRKPTVKKKRLWNYAWKLETNGTVPASDAKASVPPLEKVTNVWLCLSAKRKCRNHHPFEIIGTYNISIWFTTSYRHLEGKNVRLSFCSPSRSLVSPDPKNVKNFLEPLCWSYLFW